MVPNYTRARIDSLRDAFEDDNRLRAESEQSRMVEFTQAMRLKFPGMRSTEAQLMRRWLALHESEYDRFDYNVRIGAARDPGPQFPDWVRKAAKDCSQLRMDAIAFKGNQATIIELKKWAYPDGAQQLALYGAVWWSENAALPRPQLLLVAVIVDQATWATASAANIRIVEMGYA